MYLQRYTCISQKVYMYIFWGLEHCNVCANTDTVFGYKLQLSTPQMRTCDHSITITKHCPSASRSTEGKPPLYSVLFSSLVEDRMPCNVCFKHCPRMFGGKVRVFFCAAMRSSVEMLPSVRSLSLQ